MLEDQDKNLHADTEIERLIQPYSMEETVTILESFKKNEDRVCVVYAWEDILLSPAFIYQKMIDENVAFSVVRFDFTDKLEAVVFVCMHQLERVNLTDSYRKYLIGKAYLSKYILTNYGKITSKFKSSMELAGPLNIASGTVLKYGEYAKAIEWVYNVEPKLADYILNEKVRISHSNTLELERIPKENLRRLLGAIENNGLKKITYSEMRFESQYNPPKGLKPSRVERNEEADEKLAIRQVPAFDPDAQVSSLALTVPSWTSSIKRVTEATNFSKISNAARNRLMRNLSNLSAGIDAIRQAIEEE